MTTPTLRATDPRSSSAPVPRVPGVDVGCDVVDVARVTGLLTRWPDARTRLFTDAELAASTRDGVDTDDPAAMRRLAARFAAKEALVKLLGRPALAWTDVEIATTDDGAPVVLIHGERTDIAVSLSHDNGIAMAVVARANNAPAPTAQGVPQTTDIRAAGGTPRPTPTTTGS